MNNKSTGTDKVSNSQDVMIMIGFKHFTQKKKQLGVIPMPIHFKDFVVSNLDEELEWANKNDNTHLKRRKTYQEQLGGIQVGDQHRKAILTYTRNSKRINEHLMGVNKKPNNAVIQNITHLQDVIKKNPLPIKLHTYSALGFDPTKHLNENGILLK